MNTREVLNRRAQVEKFQRRHDTRVVTMLFSDIVGSVRLKQILGDRGAMPLLRQHHATVRELLAGFAEGEEIETAGDSFFIVFAKPSDAVRFSLLFQAKLRKLAEETGHPVLDRIGIHVGEVWVNEPATPGRTKDLYGIQVDICARVCGLASADQVLLTRFAFDSARQVITPDDIASLAPLSWLNYGPYLVKGIEEPLEICEVGEVGKAALFRPANIDKAQRFISPDEEPVLGWRPAIDQPVPGTGWVLERKLGEGGFGEVWLGRDKGIDKRYIFKFCFRADRVRSLKREVTLFRLLKEGVGTHPNIVAVEATYFDEPPFYIVLQYVDARNLSAWCDAQGGIEKLPFAIRLELVAQTADALQAAHDCGVIHRDVKPSNILVSGGTEAPRVHLTDFGIGQIVSEEALTRVARLGFSQTIMESPTSHGGTHLYMAPEMIAERSSSIRSDIYALGVVLFQLLTGDFSRPVTTDWAKYIPDPLLREDLEKCFAGDPEERFAGAGQLAGQLRSLGQRRAARAEQQALADARERAAYRRGILRAAVVALTVVAAITLLAGYALQQAGRAERNAKAEAIQRQQAEEQTRRAEAAAIQARENLSRSYFLQALRSIDEHRSDNALAELSRSLTLSPGNDAALCRLSTVLLYHSIGVPLFRLGHNEDVEWAQFSPDGRLIVTASRDDTARIWDAQTGQPVTQPLRHEGDVGSAQFSPNGKQVLTASADHTVRGWDAQSGELLTRLRHDRGVWSAQFSPNGERIVTACVDHNARIWDAHSGELLTMLKHGAPVRRALFSPDGQKIVTISDDATARVWDALSGQQLVSLKHDGAISSARFSPDGKRIATTSHDRTARIWDAESGRQLAMLKHELVVFSADFSQSGQEVATASWDGTARVWDGWTGEPLTGPLKHERGVFSARFSPDGRRIVTGSTDNTTRVWDARSGTLLIGPLRHDGEVLSARFSPDGTRILTASRDGSAVVWNAQSGRALREKMRHNGEIRTTQFSPDGQRILTASWDGTARVWNAQTSQPLTPPLQHGSIVQSARFSPDGKQVVTASQDRTAQVWDAQSGRRLTEPLQHGNEVWCAEFSPDGRRIVSASADKTARIWDARSGRLLATMKHDGVVFRAQFSPDGQQVLTASWDRTARIWNAETGRQLTGSLMHRGRVWSAQFSPDGKQVVSAAEDKSARIWNAETGAPLASSFGHNDMVVGAQFDPEGTRIVTASVDNTARVWNAKTGQPLTTPIRHKAEVWWAQFSPDGKWVVTASWDATARVWEAQTGKPLTEPLKQNARIWTAQFSPDGRRLATGSTDHTTEIWDILPSRARFPDWLPRLAEALAGQRLNEQGVFEPLNDDRTQVLAGIRAEIDRGPADNEWAIFGRWFFADRSTRTISPFVKSTVPEYIENRLKENTSVSLQEAEWLATGNAELLKRIADARARLPAK